MALESVPTPASTSESEEMYLITVARVAEDGVVGPVPVAVVAKHLQVSVASANEMIRKLSTRNLMTYEPYRGAELTPLGATVARRVLRTRRLWATFLADHLGLSPGDADDQACLLEHVTVPDAVDRLASFLGDPDTGPLGKPIPHPHGEGEPVPAVVPLSQVGVGTTATVVSVSGSTRGRTFLRGEGIVAGAVLKVEANGASGTLLQVGTELVHVSSVLADTIAVGDG